MERIRRRIQTVAAVTGVAVALTVLAPVWLAGAVLLDIVTLRRRLPVTRLLLFAWGWSLLEIAAIVLSFAAWGVGRGSDQTLHYRLQRWWAVAVLDHIDRCVGLELMVAGAANLSPGPVVVLSRHASLIDSLITAVVVARDAGLNPRMVMKKELMADPALDIVGHRVPNVFIDRGATDASSTMKDLNALAHRLGSSDAVVIFPEGTRAADARRTSALEKIGRSDAARAARLDSLKWLIPPRPAGAKALLDACPEADVVLTWHVGLDGLNTFGGIRAAVNRGPLQVKYVATRVGRSEVPSDGAFVEWLDAAWLRLDGEVDRALQRD